MGSIFAFFKYIIYQCIICKRINGKTWTCQKAMVKVDRNTDIHSSFHLMDKRIPLIITMHLLCKNQSFEFQVWWYSKYRDRNMNRQQSMQFILARNSTSKCPKNNKLCA